MRYSCFGLDLDPDILPGPLHPLNERRLPISLFSCLFWYLLSRRIAFALFGTQSFPLALFAPITLFSLLLNPSFLIFCYHAASSLHLWTSSFANVLVLPHRSSFFTSILVSSSLFFSRFEGRPASRALFPAILDIYYNPPHRSCFFELHCTRGFSHRRPIFICFSFCVIAFLIVLFDFSYLSMKYSRRSW